MRIKEFSERSGVTITKIRNYIRMGLLQPTTGDAGRTRPYYQFSHSDLRLVAAIQSGQALGMSLAEIKPLVEERQAGRIGKARLVEAMNSHRTKLVQRVTELEALIDFVDEKIASLQGGRSRAAQQPLRRSPPSSEAASNGFERRTLTR